MSAYLSSRRVDLKPQLADEIHGSRRGRTPISVAVDPAGKFAYVANNGSNDVSMYSIDLTTGALTLIGTIGS